MNEIFKIIENIKKASAVEIKMGFKNAAVFGGFSAFVMSSLNKVYELAGRDFPSETAADIVRLNSIMKKYVEYGSREREDILRGTLNLLNTLAINKQKSGIPSNSKQVLPKGIDKPNVATNNKPARVKTSENKKRDESKSAAVSDSQVSELQFLKSVGPKRVRLLNRLGISTVRDLLYHFPRRYEDRSHLKKFYQLEDGETETVTGTVVGCQDIRPRKGLTITKAAIHDGNSVGYAVWFNQPYIKKQIPQGTEILITGKVEKKFGSIQISVADYEVADKENPIHTGRIVPVYPTTEGLQTRALRTIMKFAVDKYGPEQEEFLPDSLLAKYGFVLLPEALSQVHFPVRMEEVEEARRRLIFEELFLLQLGVCMLKASGLDEMGIKHKKEGPLVGQFLTNVPFALTEAQTRVLEEIFKDMEDQKPMNRLVQGDVGCGKTVVAAAALVKTVESGYQGAMMAPTEILAGQHFEGLQEVLQPLGIHVALLTGSIHRSEKAETIDNIKTGRVDIVVGTHAVIQDEVEFQKLGLAVTDEQHRFGVRQRAMLQKKGKTPDVLVMTATPIPRTLALTVYGDLDISVIDRLPPDRLAIKTHWINGKMKERVYKFIREQVSAGRQVYYICPLVEESDKIDVQAAVEKAEELQTKVFPDLTVGLMHGRLKQDEKDSVMREFKDGRVNIMVATTVVEVGVDVPNATMIVIEDADRFGLAQLHQLRGRVGRGKHQSYCILVANPSTEEGRARMNIMQSTGDGFIIAEEDLKLRGPGEFFGTRQSGMPDLKIADIIKDVRTLQTAREEAMELVKRDPGLNKPEHRRLKESIIEKFKSTDNYIKTS